MSAAARPLPPTSGAMAPFWDAARRRELVVQRCTRCGTLRFPARELCSACLSREASWVRVSGRATVFSLAVMHQAYHPGFEVPYAVVVVELEEGVRLLTNVVGVGPHEVTIGMPVEVVFEDVTAEFTLPKFGPRS